jgi:hypothetical protein
MVNMEDEYPGIAIKGVTGYDEAGQSVKVNAMTIDEKIAYWRGVMKYGLERGFDIYICNWNVFLSTADGKHGLTDSTDNLKTQEYLRKCVIELFQTYPDLKGFGITVGGWNSTTTKEEWRGIFRQGVMQYAKKIPATSSSSIASTMATLIILKHFAQ